MKLPAEPASDREAILQRAIIGAIADYYFWPEMERERYRSSVPREQDFPIRREVLKGFDDEQYLIMNSTLPPLYSVGENDSFRNVWLADGVTLLDFETLDAVRFRHFFGECHRIVGDISELAVSIEPEGTAALEFLQAQYGDILQHFDPSVVWLRKKREIIMINGVW